MNDTNTFTLNSGRVIQKRQNRNTGEGDTNPERIIKSNKNKPNRRPLFNQEQNHRKSNSETNNNDILGKCQIDTNLVRFILNI